MLNFSRGTWATLGLLVSVFALAAALYLQINKSWFPCPLCILQRYAYMATALGFLGFWLVGGRGACLTVLKLFTGLAAFTGAGLAFYHVWVLAHPQQTCGVDPLQLTLNALPWVSLWPNLFESDGLCSDVYPPLLGLDLPAWSGLGFVALGLLLVFSGRRR